LSEKYKTLNDEDEIPIARLDLTDEELIEMGRGVVEILNKKKVFLGIKQENTIGVKYNEKNEKNEEEREKGEGEEREKGEEREETPPVDFHRYW